jgi:hypothetical protein
LVRSWIVEITEILQEKQSEGTEDTGPYSEIEYWKSRFSKLNSVLEQLKKDEYKAIVVVMKAMSSTTYKEWSALDIQLTDAINESKVSNINTGNNILILFHL